MDRCEILKREWAHALNKGLAFDAENPADFAKENEKTAHPNGLFRACWHMAAWACEQGITRRVKHVDLRGTDRKAVGCYTVRIVLENVRNVEVPDRSYTMRDGTVQKLITPQNTVEILFTPDEKADIYFDGFYAIQTHRKQAARRTMTNYARLGFVLTEVEVF